VAKFSQLAKPKKKFKVAKNMWFFSFPSRQVSGKTFLIFFLKNP
jgi:hypothetical protein